MGNLSGLRGASDDDPLLELDARGRVSLAKLAQHRRYLATVQDGGQILLTPVTIVPADTIPITPHRGDREGRPQRGTAA